MIEEEEDKRIYETIKSAIEKLRYINDPGQNIGTVIVSTNKVDLDKIDKAIKRITSGSM